MTVQRSQINNVLFLLWFETEEGQGSVPQLRATMFPG